MEKEKTLTLGLPIALAGRKAVLISSAVFLLSFFVPFMLGHPQWLVGTIVNACLFLSATFLSKKMYLPLIILPSLGVLARGVIFGPLTAFLIYFLPFLWLGNLLLIIVFRRTYYLKYPFSVFIASAVKYLFLFSVAGIYFKLGFVPAVFLQAMGLNQLSTALAGGIMSYIIFSIYGQYIAGNKRVA